MPCDEIEKLIQDQLDGRLSPELDCQIKSHLATCSPCREFARQLQKLDAALSSVISTPVLSSSFDQRVWRQIENAPSTLSALEVADRKRRFQQEFESGLAQIRRSCFSWRNWLGLLAWPVLAFGAASLVWRMVSLATTQLPSTPATANFTAWAAATAVFLCISFAGSLRQGWKDTIFR